MGNGLCAVDEHRDVVGVSSSDDALHVVDSAKSVVHMSHADELGVGCDELFQFREDEVAVFVDGDGTKFCSLQLAHLLPGHDIGMVVEGGDNHVVAFFQEFPAERLCHQIDAFSRATHKEDVLLGRSIDEARHLLTGTLILVGAACCQGVGTTMDVRVVGLVELAQSIDDPQRLLGGRTIVEPHEVVAIHLLMEDGELLADFFGVHRVGLVVMEVANDVRLGNSDAKAIILQQTVLLLRLHIVRASR